MSVKRFKSDAVKFSQIDFDSKRLKFTFRNGKIYSTDKDIYSVNTLNQFMNIRPNIATENLIREQKNLYIKNNTRGGRSVIESDPVACVVYKQRQDDSDTVLKETCERIYDDFIGMWGPYIGSEYEDFFILTNSEESFQDKLLENVYTQDGKPLSGMRKGYDYVGVKTNIGFTYFYTEHKRNNGYELWYKAIDPFCLLCNIEGK